MSCQSPLYTVHCIHTLFWLFHLLLGGFWAWLLCALCVKLTLCQVWLQALTWTESCLFSRTQRRGFIHTRIFCREERFGLSDHFLPALTCCHSENKRRIQGNGQTIGSTTPLPIKRKRPERTGKAPTTPVRTHLGAQKIPQDPHITALQIIFALTKLDKSRLVEIQSIYSECSGSDNDFWG